MKENCSDISIKSSHICPFFMIKNRVEVVTDK